MADEYDPTVAPSYDEAAGDSYENGEYAYDKQDDGDEEEEEDDDYDPSSFNFGGEATHQPAQQDQHLEMAQPSAAPAIQTEQSAKPKTAAGFIIEESDDEDEEHVAPTPPQINGTEGAQSGVSAVAESEAQNVSLASEPTHDTAAATVQDAQNASLNGSTASTATPLASADVAPSIVTASVPAPPSQHTALVDQGKDVSSATVGTNATTSVANTPKPAVNGVTAPPATSAPQSLTAQRLPHDKVGRLEDRIKEDPKADTDAWLSLIQHYRDKDQIDNARNVYDRFLQVFPTAPTIWTSYTNMEFELFDKSKIEAIFGTALPQVPNVELWTMYLEYLRRVFPINPDPQGQNRGIIMAAFEAVLDNVGIDPDSGRLWRDYIDFVKGGPGNLAGTGWQDLQKIDNLRKAYHRATKSPHEDLAKLWKEYDSFEIGNSKAGGRKALQEQSPHYMSARTAKTQMDQKIDRLDRRSLPVLPPVYGFEGEEAFAVQVEKWRSWIEWEKEDPLVLETDELPLFRKRIVYVYKQATMQLRFYPQIWFEAAMWCFEQHSDDMVAQGEDFLDRGIAANPESLLLTLTKADRIEASLPAGSTDDVIIANGEKLDIPYENNHKALYSLREKMAKRQEAALKAIQEHFASLPPEEDEPMKDDDDDDDDDLPTEKPKSRQEQMQAQIQIVKTASAAQLETIKRTISYVWVAKMRAFRRIQGQGMPNKPKKGFRGVFGEARPRGQLSSDVYIASALMEWHCYKDQSALKIFERGLKLFPADEVFALEYIKHLVSNNDLTNARVVFETTLTKILGTNSLPEPQRKEKCRPLLHYMHEFESNYGDLAQIHKLEKRMADMFPNEPAIERFAHRFAMPSFDGMQVQLVISMKQVVPRASFAMPPQQPMPTIEAPGMHDEGTLRLGPNGPYMASPKRPLEDSDTDSPQRKFMRGESPLKGAAGRRIQHQSGGSISSATIGGGPGSTGAGGFVTKNYVPGATAAPTMAAAPTPLPREVNFLLQIIPPARAFPSHVAEPAHVMEVLRSVNIEAARARIMAAGYQGR